VRQSCRFNLKSEVQDPKAESRIRRLARVLVWSAGLQPAYDAAKPGGGSNNIRDTSPGLDGLSRSQTGAPADWVRPKRLPLFQNGGQLISAFGLLSAFEDLGFGFRVQHGHANRR
jgi:hypothetical protein